MQGRKICVITGTRAEYGLLHGLMEEIKKDEDLVLQIVATGMHLSHEFGLTYKQVEQDGFTINSKVEMLLSSDTPIGITKSVGLGTIGFADVYEQLKPDIVVLLGDRYEILAAAQAAMIAKIPMAHIHGGETTEGAIDEAIRHSITKMSHIHFVAAEPYKKRVIQLGENPARVYNFGALGIDNIINMKLLDKHEFEKSINFCLGDTNFLVTYHPVTLNTQGSIQAIESLLEALDEFPNAKIIFTKSNSDHEGRIMNSIIDEYVQVNPNRASSYTSLGQLRYLSAIRHVDVVIGNSSSGIIEVPIFKKPTVNIGKRQSGRLKAVSVIDCGESKEEIVSAIRVAFTNDFKEKTANSESLYGCGDVALNIKKTLKYISLEKILIKEFYDLPI